MPILNIEIIGDVNEATRLGLADRLAEAAGAALDSRPQGTWVKVKYLPKEQYSENGGGPPGGSYPVIISLIQADPPDGEALKLQVSKLTDAIAAAIGRSKANIHIVIEPAAAGRIAFGGNLVE